ncbi:hypothetical protein MKW98_011295, partial [Papaver atlanticum]
RRVLASLTTDFQCPYICHQDKISWRLFLQDYFSLRSFFDVPGGNNSVIKNRTSSDVV